MAAEIFNNMSRYPDDMNSNQKNQMTLPNVFTRIHSAPCHFTFMG